MSTSVSAVCTARAARSTCATGDSGRGVGSAAGILLGSGRISNWTGLMRRPDLPGVTQKINTAHPTRRREGLTKAGRFSKINDEHLLVMLARDEQPSDGLVPHHGLHRVEVDALRPFDPHERVWRVLDAKLGLLLEERDGGGKALAVAAPLAADRAHRRRRGDVEPRDGVDDGAERAWERAMREELPALARGVDRLVDVVEAVVPAAVRAQVAHLGRMHVRARREHLLPLLGEHHPAVQVPVAPGPEEERNRVRNHAVNRAVELRQNRVVQPRGDAMVGDGAVDVVVVVQFLAVERVAGPLALAVGRGGCV
ncbi:hypothetical protein DAEQUDRAFT_102497 [Daedalea quercina L-15889]|uniref:Uncharacterized protein n=1 Tax=Daedalea quercina L-15889 TaxID=1314783 RepID=A0A165KVE9_9APHY|nr:hypothetical protein DAEQUDRAFT_102497 [Daedalea quercina L-15889]